jgi:malate permease and related proteins
MTPTLILIGKLAPAYGYVLAGYIVKRAVDIKERLFANLLFYCLIPITVFKGALLSKVGHFLALTALAFGTSIVLAAASRPLSKRFSERISPGMLACLFSYLNIGWFGIPIVQAVYGDEGAAIMSAFYVGGMVFGNTIGYAMASAKSATLAEEAWKLAKIPALTAVVLALLLRAFFPGASEWIISNLQKFLSLGTLLTSVCGMALVGMSVANTRLAHVPWRFVTEFLVVRFVAIAVVTYLINWALMSLGFIGTMDSRIYLLYPTLPIAANLLVFSAKDATDQQEYQLVGIVLFASTIVSFCLLLTAA